MHSPHKRSHYFKFKHTLGSHFLSSGWLLGYMKRINYPMGVSHLKLISTFRPLPIRINSNDTRCPVAQEGPVHWGELFLWNYKGGTQGQLGHPDKACPAPSPNPIWSSLSEWVQVTPLFPTLCNSMDYTVRGILQASILEWVAFPFSRGSSQPRDRTQVSHIAGRFFTSWAR